MRDISLILRYRTLPLRDAGRPEIYARGLQGFEASH